MSRRRGLSKLSSTCTGEGRWGKSSTHGEEGARGGRKDGITGGPMLRARERGEELDVAPAHTRRRAASVMNIKKVRQLRRRARPSTTTTWNTFTTVMLLANASLVAAGAGDSSPAWAVVSCWNIGCAVPFLVLPAVDPTAVRRKARREGWPPWLFHAGNAALHYVPLLLAALHPPTVCRPGHGVAAAALHLAWTVSTPEGTPFLDDTYISLPRGRWVVLWASALASEVAWACCAWGVR
jgi:hypothetical protein